MIDRNYDLTICFREYRTVMDFGFVVVRSQIGHALTKVVSVLVGPSSDRTVDDPDCKSVDH